MKDVLFVFDAEGASRAAVVLRRAEVFCRPDILPMPGASHAELLPAVQQIEAAARNGTPVVFLIGFRPGTSAGHALALAHRVPPGAPSVVIDISKIKTLRPDATTRPTGVPAGAAFHFWLKDDGYANLGQWLLRPAHRADAARRAMAPLLARRSVSPKRLRAPGPGLEDIDVLLQAGLRAPDHGGLHPWRVIEFRAEQRRALADSFEQEKLRRDPLASAADLRIAREHATRAPVLLAFVVAPRLRSKVPAREQWLAAGAALGNLLNAAHQLGFGAIVLSGERCFDAKLTAALGVRPEEFLAGFISLGTVSDAPPSKKHTLPAEVWTCWTPPATLRTAAIAQPLGSTHTYFSSP